MITPAPATPENTAALNAAASESVTKGISSYSRRAGAETLQDRREVHSLLRSHQKEAL